MDNIDLYNLVFQKTELQKELYTIFSGILLGQAIFLFSFRSSTSGKFRVLLNFTVTLQLLMGAAIIFEISSIIVFLMADLPSANGQDWLKVGSVREISTGLWQVLIIGIPALSASTFFLVVASLWKFDLGEKK